MSAAKTKAKKADSTVSAKKGKTEASTGIGATMTLKPRMSEKSYALSKDGVYVFDVPMQANKALVAAAVSEQFKVTVEDVRLLIAKGKKARSIRIGGARRMIFGKRPDVKKAYVTVKPGDQIPIFAEVEKAEEAEKKAAEKAKKEAK